MSASLRFSLGAALGALPGTLVFLIGGASITSIAYLFFCVIYGGLTMAMAIYAFRPLSLLGFVLDLTWSLLNTVTGLIWLPICLLRGTGQTVSVDTQRSGTLVIAGEAAPGADATTLGNVIGGKWAAHEEVHVWQARLFGPLYWPIYVLSYAANLLALALTGRFGNLHWEAYGRVCMEDWAYGADPVFGGPIQWGPWFLGLLLASLSFACLLAILAGWLPFVAAAPLVIVAGVMGALLDALARSRFKAN